jgi:lipopolysaccharide export system protein LptA
MSRMSRPLIAALLLGLAVPAASQGAGPGASALKNHDTRAPIDIDAERIEVRDRESQAIFTGDVQVKQAAMNLGAATLRVFYERSGGGNPTILRIDAEGGVSLTTPSERARASYGIYDVSQRQLTMIGDVVLTQGDSVLRGQRLAIDLDSGRSTLDGATGGGARSRVTGRFVVPQRSN